MSADHPSTAFPPTAQQQPPVFLSVRPGQFVIVNESTFARADDTSWWMGQVIFCEGGARDPGAHSLFQVANVDDGVVKWINADQVSHILHSLDGLASGR